MLQLETLLQAKDKLRQQIKANLNKLSQKEKDIQSTVVVNKVLSSKVFQECQRISIYLPMKNEVNTLPILRAMLNNGKQCFIPHYHNDDMIMSKLESWEHYEKLPINTWGIRQPTHFDLSNDAILNGGLDLILMPGLAFTKDGRRLGRGKGYYDKYLQKCEDLGLQPKTVALLFKEQLVDNVPISDNDKLVDFVFYPSEEEMSTSYIF
ncbi:5-formyltetrahydrofolate cyclo-ligase [Biomphalaria glabrata]